MIVFISLSRQTLKEVDRKGAVSPADAAMRTLIKLGALPSEVPEEDAINVLLRLETVGPEVHQDAVRVDTVSVDRELAIGDEKTTTQRWLIVRNGSGLEHGSTAGRGQQAKDLACKGRLLDMVDHLAEKGLERRIGGLQQRKE